MSSAQWAIRLPNGSYSIISAVDGASSFNFINYRDNLPTAEKYIVRLMLNGHIIFFEINYKTGNSLEEYFSENASAFRMKLKDNSASLAMLLTPDELDQTIPLPAGCPITVTYDTARFQNNYAVQPYIDINTNQLKFTLNPEPCMSADILLKKDCGDGCPENIWIGAKTVNITTSVVGNCSTKSVRVINCMGSEDNIHFYLYKLDENGELGELVSEGAGTDRLNAYDSGTYRVICVNTITGDTLVLPPDVSHLEVVNFTPPTYDVNISKVLPYELDRCNYLLDIYRSMPAAPNVLSDVYVGDSLFYTFTNNNISSFMEIATVGCESGDTILTIKTISLNSADTCISTYFLPCKCYAECDSMAITDFTTTYYTYNGGIYFNHSGTKVTFVVSGQKNIIGVTAYPIGVSYSGSVTKKGLGSPSVEASMTFNCKKTGLDTIPMEVCVIFEDSTECCKIVEAIVKCSYLQDLSVVSPCCDVSTAADIHYGIVGSVLPTEHLQIDFLDANGDLLENIMDDVPSSSATISFNVSPYPTGTYFIKFQIADQIETIQFMKE
jgi:hypothetical protein